MRGARSLAAHLLVMIGELAQGLIRHGSFVAMVPLFFNYVIIQRGSRRACVTPSP